MVVKKKVSDRVCASFWSSHTPLILSPVNQCVSVQAAPPDVASRTVRSSSRSMMPLPSTSAVSNRRFSPSADAREAGVHRPPSMDPRGWGGREGGLMGDECVCEEGETGDAACVSVGEAGSWRSLSLPFSSSCRPRHRWDCDTVKGRRLVWWGGRVRAWRGCPNTHVRPMQRRGHTQNLSHTRPFLLSHAHAHTRTLGSAAVAAVATTRRRAGVRTTVGTRRVAAHGRDRVKRKRIVCVCGCVCVCVLLL